MKRQHVCLLAAGVLYAGAALGARARSDPASVAVAVVRPFVLPFLWAGMLDAQRHGTPEEAVVQARALLRLLPQWTDGLIHTASLLAFDASLAARGPDAALERLLAALALLEDGLGKGARADAEILAAMASFLAIRTAADQGLGDAFRRRIGVEPAARADSYLQRAEALLPTPELADRRTFLLMQLIAGALRTGDRQRALATIALAQERLGAVRDQRNAEQWRRSLSRLAGFLGGKPGITLTDLRADPLLERIVAALDAAGVK